jgi:hypothetical protein
MTFVQGFLSMASKIGEKERARGLAFSIPSELAEQELSYDTLSDHVRYSFGLPFQHNGIPFAVGTTQMPELSTFTLVFIAASKILDPVSFEKYCRYLFTPAKHQDAMLEFRPILTSRPIDGLEYETQGRGSKKIDWKISYPDITILLDVKNRSGNTYEHLFSIIQSKGEIPIPNTKAEVFFKSTQEKFQPNKSAQVLQGIWVHVGIKENARTLDAYFETEIDPDLLQFYVIAGWGNECHVKARTVEQEEAVLAAFSLVRSDQFVFYQ